MRPLAARTTITLGAGSFRSRRRATRSIADPLLTATESYGYEAFSNQLLSSSSTLGDSRTVTHGDSGNREADVSVGPLANKDFAFAYDSSDRLVEVSNAGVPLGHYLHNGMGQRVSKTVGVTTTHFLYDLGGNLIAEADGATGATTAEYIAFEGMNLAFVTTGGIYWIHGDHLGTPQVLTDETGAEAWSAAYAPFGAAEVTSDAGLTFNPRFPGQYKDEGSSGPWRRWRRVSRSNALHYNYFRTYDPSTGRYVESDPIGLRGGWNTYLYALGSPTLFTDRRGLRPDGVRCRADKPVLIDSWILKSTEWPTGRTESRFDSYDYDTQSIDWGLGKLPPPDRLGYGIFVYSARFRVYRIWEEMDKNDLYQVHKYIHVRCRRNNVNECGILEMNEKIHVSIQEAGTRYVSSGTYWKPTDKTYEEFDDMMFLFIGVVLW